MIVTPATTDHKVTVTQNSSIVTVSSVGTVGPRGGAGTSVLSGNGVPASSLGADGDHYLNQTAFRLYVKSDGAWVDQGAYGGDQGPAGTAATIAVGTVTTGNAGTSAAVSNAGNTTAATFNFTIPKGDAGTNGLGCKASGTGYTSSTGVVAFASDD